MVYLWVFLGLILAIIGLSIANFLVKRRANKKSQSKEEE